MNARANFYFIPDLKLEVKDSKIRVFISAALIWKMPQFRGKKIW
jgi:hypothetical protein